MKTYNVVVPFKAESARDSIKKLWGGKFDREKKVWVVNVSDKDAEKWPNWLEWANKKHSVIATEVE